MLVTATELKQNLGRYLDMAADEDIYVSRQGKGIIRLSQPSRDKVAILDGLVGLAVGTALTASQAKNERLASA